MVQQDILVPVAAIHMMWKLMQWEVLIITYQMYLLNRRAQKRVQQDTLVPVAVIVMIKKI